MAENAARAQGVVRAGGKVELPGTPGVFVPRAKVVRGRVLPYRLSRTLSRWVAILVLGIFGLIWNGGIGLWFGGVLSGESDFDGFVACFLIPFAVIGLAILGAVIYMILQAQVPVPVVEISDEPLFPGQTFRLYVRQDGPVTMDKLTVKFICQEAATYRRGTDTTTDTHNVIEEVVVEERDVVVSSAKPFEKTVECQVPAVAMHSFEMSNNKVTWLFKVQASIARWPDTDDEFAVRVLTPEQVDALPAEARRLAAS